MEDILNILKNNINDSELSLDEQISEFESFDESELIANNLLKLNLDNKIKINESFFIDLEIFQDHLNNKEKSVSSKINKTITLFGNVMLNKKLSYPINDILLLNKQKDSILYIFQNIDTYEKYLNYIKSTENDLLWFWKDIDENTESIYSMIFFQFKYLKFLNYNESLMNIYTIYTMFLNPIMSTLSPLYSIIFLVILKIYYKIKIPLKKIFNLIKQLFFKKIKDIFSNIKIFFSMCIWLLFYIYNIYQNISFTMSINKITNIFHCKLLKIIKFLEASNNIYLINNNLVNYKIDFNPLVKSLNSRAFKDKPSLFSNKGRIISTYYTFLNIKDKLIPIMNFIGDIDVLYSSAILLKKYNFTLPNYINDDKLIYDIKDTWHPYLSDNIVKNSIELNKNVIITGPNAAGKSTFIKTLMLNTLLSQTLSISSSRCFNLTPFDIIYTYLHIPDTKGKESLFEAELNRCSDIITDLSSNKKNKSFIIMDEVFSSTNPSEGCQAAHKVCQKLNKFKNNITIITTHYNNLTKLEKKYNFINYNFKIDRDKKNNIIFTYKLKKGISRDKIALELLSKKLKKL